MSLGKVGSIMFTMQIIIGVHYELRLDSPIICSLANSCFYVPLTLFREFMLKILKYFSLFIHEIHVVIFETSM